MMIYGFCLLVLSGLFVLAAMVWGGWAWLLLYPSFSFMVVGLCYLKWGASPMGKREDGTIRRLCLLYLLPYGTCTWFFWWVTGKLEREPPYAEVSPKLFVGRRVSIGEIPEEIEVIVDMTCEFSEPKAIREKYKYYCLPTLDGYVPKREALEVLARRVASSEETIYVHCAEGHGRSAMFAAAVLIYRGVAEDLQHAVRLMKRVRPTIMLSVSQRELVRSLCQPLFPVTSEPGR